MDAFGGGACDGAESLDDLAVFAAAECEFDLATGARTANATANDVGRGDALDAQRRDGHAETRADETENRQPLRALLDNLRAEPVLLAERHGLCVGALAGGTREEDEGLVAKFGGGNGFALREPVAPGQRSDERFREDGFDLEAFGGTAVSEEADVERAFEQRANDASGVKLTELKINLGELAAVAAEHRWKKGQHAGADESHVEEPDFAATDAARDFDVIVDLAERAAGAIEEDFSGRREFDRTRGTGKERVTQHVFEFTDLLRERGLREVKATGGAPEVEFLGNRNEVAKMT